MCNDSDTNSPVHLLNSLLQCPYYSEILSSVIELLALRCVRYIGQSASPIRTDLMWWFHFRCCCRSPFVIIIPHSFAISLCNTLAHIGCKSNRCLENCAEHMQLLSMHMIVSFGLIQMDG